MESWLEEQVRVLVATKDLMDCTLYGPHDFMNSLQWNKVTETNLLIVAYTWLILVEYAS